MGLRFEIRCDLWRKKGISLFQWITIINFTISAALKGSLASSGGHKQFVCVFFFSFFNWHQFSLWWLIFISLQMKPFDFTMLFAFIGWPVVSMACRWFQWPTIGYCNHLAVCHLLATHWSPSPMSSHWNETLKMIGNSDGLFRPISFQNV